MLPDIILSIVPRPLVGSEGVHTQLLQHNTHAHAHTHTRALTKYVVVDANVEE